ncbi:MAG: 1-deoxy-D-xylulose-5-phosphate synthase [Oscillospiraceae bacterium]|nr:1-deoxy-D-xylulose-5-phosphate synthase [Oscillospiraceae bacterium]
MKDLNILPGINSPSDLKKLDDGKLIELSAEIREVLIDTVSRNGGHLASNLGVAELTIALHKCFNSPEDKIIWDVGHQSYVHKLLTGRYRQFQTLRTENGISGFSRPTESEHDIFFGGHGSTSVSAAYGIDRANAIKGNKNYTVAVIGDGAFTGGMVYEALNNAGGKSSRLIVILNNNEMSISKNVGQIAAYFAAIRANPAYFRLKAKTENIINHIPLIGKKLSTAIFRTKTILKNIIYGSSMFEYFGFRYMGPIDGHDIKHLRAAMEGAKMANYPILLHVKTVKGKGYPYAENDPTSFHGISKFDIDTGEPIIEGTNFSLEFGMFLTEIASKDRRICSITAAMEVGTGLTGFKAAHPDRFFDVGIAEEHAVTFASGLAKAGMIPVFCVYSAFLQRAYDQLVHDGALQNIKIIIAIDRAGFAGEDGETHQGILDVPFLNTIPNITVYSPSAYEEMRNAFVNGFYHDGGVVAVRYYRGKEELPSGYTPVNEAFDIYGDKNSKYVIITYGRIFKFAAEAANELTSRDVKIFVLKLNKIKPIDKNTVKNIVNCDKIFFFEEGERSGGVGESFRMILSELNYKGDYVLTAIDNAFVPHADTYALLNRYKLDFDGICETVIKNIT